jgi:predicted DNA-binding transcriptional regulator YafY
MKRKDRLFDIVQILKNGQLHRAQDIADALNVTVRTVYRDMDTLMASGVPVRGERGFGYTTTAQVTLPPLNLTTQELEALNLGMAIVAESADPDLKSAALSLAAKVDSVLPSQSQTEADVWKHVVYPFANAARGFAHIPTLRAAISARQKLYLTYQAPNGTVSRGPVRPLQLDCWSRAWALTTWCELENDFKVFRVDLILEAKPIAALFVDEHGKRLQDYNARAGRT